MALFELDGHFPNKKVANILMRACDRVLIGVHCVCLGKAAD